MKKIIFSLVLVLSTLAICSAQKIEMKKVFGGYQFSQDGKRMNMKNLVNLMESNSEALTYMKKAKSNNVLATVLGLAGGGLIGYPIGGAISGGDANWTLAGIGAGILAIGIPISSSVNKNAKKAVDLYNESLDTSSYYEFKPEFEIMVKGSGIGLVMTF